MSAGNARWQRPASSPERRFKDAEVMEALEKVLGSPSFARSPRLQAFLRYVVEERLSGRFEPPKEYELGVRIFGRSPDFDPQVDPIVRVQARQLRFKIAEYYAREGATDHIVFHLPKGGYAAHFERRMTTVAPAAVELVPARALRVWLYTAAGVLCLAAALIAWRAFARRESPASLAVLPFTNLTANPTNQYFSDGLTDEITDSLARVKTLRVIAPSSAFQFKGKTVDVREIGRSLKVGHVLEGSVEQSGDRIKVVAHLERVSDGSPVWSNTYEGRTSDLFTMQTELAAGIAGSLRATAGVPAGRHVPSPEAHDSHMRGRYDLQQVTVDSVARAEKEFQHAIDLDPQYAAAYLGLGTAKYDEFVASGSVYQIESGRRDAEQLLRKALELDPDLPSAHALLAMLALQYDWNWGRAERELQLAVTDPSSATAESFYALLLIFRGRFSEADQHIQRMLDLDPFSTATLNNLALARYLEGRFGEAREVAQRLAAQYPKMLGPQQLIGGTYIAENHPGLALPIFRQLKQRFPQAALFEAMACARAGQRDRALALIRPFEEKFQNSGVSLQWFALVYAVMGDEPNTVKWLGRSADRHEWQALTLAVNPAFAQMRNSPGFQALEKRMGLQ